MLAVRVCEPVSLHQHSAEWIPLNVQAVVAAQPMQASPSHLQLQRVGCRFLRLSQIKGQSPKPTRWSLESVETSGQCD
jgi:hypothetical protein